MQSFLTVIEQQVEELPAAERKVANYILQNPSSPIYMTMTELAAASGASPAIVVRLCKRLNVDGYPELKIRLSREVFNAGNDAGSDDDSDQLMENFYDAGLPTPELISQYIKFTAKNLRNLESILDAKVVDEAAKLINQADTIILLGTGASETVVSDLQYKFARLGKNILYTKDANLQTAQAYFSNPGTVGFAVSYFGEDDSLLKACKALKEVGGKLVSLTKIGNNHLSRLADVKIQIPASGYEYRTGSTLSRISQIFVTDVLYSAVSSLMSEDEKAVVLKRWNNSMTRT